MTLETTYVGGDNKNQMKYGQVETIQLSHPLKWLRIDNFPNQDIFYGTKSILYKTNGEYLLLLSKTKDSIETVLDEKTELETKNDSIFAKGKSAGIDVNISISEELNGQKNYIEVPTKMDLSIMKFPLPEYIVRDDPEFLNGYVLYNDMVYKILSAKDFEASLILDFCCKYEIFCEKANIPPDFF